MELDKTGKYTLAQQKKKIARGLAKSIPLLVKASPVDTGLYAQSWYFSVDEEKAIIGNFSPIGMIIEYGARPHMPPLEPLLQWAKRVLKDPSQPPDYSPAVQALARGTQMKIFHYGAVPKHILENAIPLIIENIRQEFENAD